MQLSFRAWDVLGKEYQVTIEKIGFDKAVIFINDRRYDVSNLEKNMLGTIVKGKVNGSDMSLHVIWDSQRPFFTLNLAGSSTYYFNVLDCLNFVSWIQAETMTIVKQ